MKPDDDATWPKCEHEGIQNIKHWCSMSRDYLIAGRDAVSICPGMRYCVPIVPAKDIYAEVSIGNEVVPGLAWELSLVKSGPLFTSDEELIQLGLWSPGEGRLSIASTLDDWAASQPDFGLCNHGFPEEMIHQAAVQTDEDGSYARANRWTMLTAGVCPHCASQGTQQVAPVTYNAADYGLTPASGSRAPSGNSRDQRTRDALRNKYSRAQQQGHEPIPQGANDWTGYNF